MAVYTVRGNGRGGLVRVLLGIGRAVRDALDAGEGVRVTVERIDGRD